MTRSSRRYTTPHAGGKSLILLQSLIYILFLLQVGAIITYRFQDLTKAGVPRFPTFVGERFDVTGPKDAVLLEKSTGEEEA